MSTRFEVHLRAIQCRRKHEGGDEIYFRVDGEARRRAGDPDYWRFDVPGVRYELSLLVFAGTRGEQVVFELCEQDTFADDNLGVLRIAPHSHADAIDWGRGERWDTTYRGARGDRHVVMFHGQGAIYSLEFSVARVDA